MSTTTVVSDWLFLNKTTCKNVFQPESQRELVHFIKNSSCTVSIAGAQFSHGGQTLPINDQSCMISMTKLNRFIKANDQEYTVESGITWKDVILNLEKQGLVPIEMQSYSSFTVGGAVSVNAHGRSGGRVGDTIISMTVCLADGTVITCSKSECTDLFSAVIGGYGLIGIIMTVTLRPRKNFPITCHVKMRAFHTDLYTDVLHYSKHAALYNCNITNSGYQHIYWTKGRKIQLGTDARESFSWHQKENALTHLFTRLGEQLISISPTILNLKQKMDSCQHGNTQMLSYEMTYSAKDLAPLTELRYLQSTLQEYFVPLDQCNHFAHILLKIIRKYRVNMVNCSVRYVRGNNSLAGGVLNWAPENRIAFVLYINTVDMANNRVQKHYRKWTQKLVNSVTRLGGTWYLPYVPVFTPENLIKGYPKLDDFRLIKEKYDPSCRLQSHFGGKLFSNPVE